MAKVFWLVFFLIGLVRSDEEGGFQGPTEPPTETPTEPAAEPTTESQTESSTELPSEATTEPTTEPTTEAPTEPATDPPTYATTEPATHPPTHATTEPRREPPRTAAPVVTTTTTPGPTTFGGGLSYDATGVKLTTEAISLAADLIFPVAQLSNFTALSRQEFINLYCEPLVSSKRAPPATIGNSAALYLEAVKEFIPPTSLLETKKSEIGRIRSLTAGASLAQRVGLGRLKRIRLLSSFLGDVSPETQLGPYGICTSDSNCSTLGRRKRCIDHICRECSPSSWQSDCPNSPMSDMCSADTGYTCSECLDDSGCSLVGGACRFTFPSIATTYPMMPRKLCTKCPFVPLSGEILDPSTCLWRCPYGAAWDGSSACVVAPVCSWNQYVGVSSNSTSVYLPGTGSVNATNPICRDCGSLGPVRDADFCANLVDIKSVSGPVGDVNNGIKEPSAQRPCSAFQCKSDHYLNSDKNKCIPCDYSRCKGGFMLNGCGVDKPGECVPCPSGNKIGNSDWANFQLADIVIAKPEMTCIAVCNFGFYRQGGACVSCDENEKTKCPVGQVLENCGPGSWQGTCQPCPPAAPNMYFTGSKCKQASCLERGSTCPPGTTLQGCGDTQQGTCVPCSGSLPSNAVAWTSGCAFMCSPGFYLDSSSNTCIECNASAQCRRGQDLTGCGIDGVKNGTCVDCPPLGRGMYYAPNQKCQASKCNPLNCTESQKLVGCGYGEIGSCAACSLPPSGIDSLSRVVTINGIRECAPRCRAGYQVTENSSSAIGISCQLIPPIDSNYDDNG
jgi:hypothetical protein